MRLSTDYVQFSGLELQVGVICNCMPVSFVVFKRASSNFWATIRRYWGMRCGRPDGSAPAIDGNGPGLLRISDEARKQLPNVPRATLTGIKMLFRGTSGRNATQSTELRTYSELNSVNDEYHAQLKKAHGTDSLTS